MTDRLERSGDGEGTEADRCPICGQGILTDIAFDAAPRSEPDLRQTAESRELITYSCGHEVPGSSVATADGNRLDVERRTSSETSEPRPSA
jgi:hypothetical protein